MKRELPNPRFMEEPSKTRDLSDLRRDPDRIHLSDKNRAFQQVPTDQGTSGLDTALRYAG